MAGNTHEGHGEEGEDGNTPEATKRPLGPQTEL